MQLTGTLLKLGHYIQVYDKVSPSIKSRQFQNVNKTAVKAFQPDPEVLNHCFTLLLEVMQMNTKV